MQRLFVTFPCGAPGIGLLLLRLAVGATVVSLVPGRGSEWVILSLSVAAAIALCAGAMTPIAAGLVVVLEVAAVFRGDLAGGPIASVPIAVAFALALLGPGGYSLDARWFGRRLIFESRKEGDSE